MKQNSLNPQNFHSGLRNLTPVEAAKIVIEFYESLLTEEERLSPDVVSVLVLQGKLKELMPDSDRPIAVLVTIISKYAAAMRGEPIGDLESHHRRLSNAWETIDRAKESENQSERKLAELLETAIVKALPNEQREKPAIGRH